MYDSVGFLFTSDSAIYAYSGSLVDINPYTGLIGNQDSTIYAYSGSLVGIEHYIGVKVIEGSTGPTAPKQRWISSF